MAKHYCTICATLDQAIQLFSTVKDTDTEEDRWDALRKICHG